MLLLFVSYQTTITMAATCLFANSEHVPECENQTSKLSTISDKKLQTVEAKCKKREDEELCGYLRALGAERRILLRVHSNCLATYTSETHIARYLLYRVKLEEVEMQLADIFDEELKG